MNLDGNIGKRLGILFFFVVAVAFLLSIAFSKAAQWDFRCYYSAATACKLGLNPYDRVVQAQLAGESVVGFLYPPHTLFLFRPFTWFGLTTASLIFLALKVAAIFPLVFLWRRLFGLAEHTGLFLVFVALAFNATLLFDLRAGNLVIFEQLIIWAGFYGYLKEKPGWFCAAVICAASVKLTPLILLGFLLTSGRRRDLAWLGISVVGFAVVMALNAVAWPELNRNFMKALNDAGSEPGVSSWWLIRDAVRWCQWRMGVDVLRAVEVAVYVTVASLACIISVITLKRTSASKRADALLWRISLACLLYAVIVPRLKEYNYILLIAPAFFVLKSLPPRSLLMLATALVMFPTATNFLVFGKMFEPFYRAISGYSPLLCAWLVWALCCCLLLRSTGAQEKNPS